MNAHTAFFDRMEADMAKAAEASVERQINLIADDLLRKPDEIGRLVYGWGNTLTGRDLVTVITDCREKTRCARAAQTNYPNGNHTVSIIDLVAAEHVLVGMLASRRAAA